MILENLRIDVMRFVSSLTDKKCSHIHILLDVFFDRIFDIFYSFRNLQYKFEYSCFPIFKLNCIQCWGCCHNTTPILSPLKSKGPWKVYTVETFNESYEKLFGKEALNELLIGLKEHNKKIDEGKL